MPSQGTAAETYWQRSCVENGKGGAASHLQVREARALRRDQQASLLYHCYQYPLRPHVGKPWTKHSAKKDQEARLLRSASTAGFFCSLAMETNRRDRQAPNPQASTPISAPLALERKRSLHRRDSAAVFKQAQRQQECIAEEHAPLPSSWRRKSTPSPPSTSSSLERRVRHGESSAVMFHHLPSAYVSWSSLQVRGRAGPVFASFFLRTSKTAEH